MIRWWQKRNESEGMDWLFTMILCGVIGIALGYAWCYFALSPQIEEMRGMYDELEVIVKQEVCR